jgi:predicted nucleic acid-binding protein
VSSAGFLLDTNVVSEIRRKRPNASVLAWVDGIADHRLYLSVLSLGEIRRGIELLDDGDKQHALNAWVEQMLLPWLGAQLVPVDQAVAESWGRLAAAVGRPLPVIDSLLAATALTHGLTMVTRNTIDFGMPELRVINPWQGDQGQA